MLRQKTKENGRKIRLPDGKSDKDMIEKFLGKKAAHLANVGLGHLKKDFVICFNVTQCFYWFLTVKFD